MQTYVLALDLALQFAVAALWVMRHRQALAIKASTRYGTRVVRHRRRKGDHA